MVLKDELRLHAEDLYSGIGYNKTAHLLSLAADELEQYQKLLSDAMVEINQLRGEYSE